jgi:hypothetical protein
LAGAKIVSLSATAQKKWPFYAGTPIKEYLRPYRLVVFLSWRQLTKKNVRQPTKHGLGGLNVVNASSVPTAEDNGTSPGQKIKHLQRFSPFGRYAP